MSIEETLVVISFIVVRFGAFLAGSVLFGLVVVLLVVVRPAFVTVGPSEWAEGRTALAARIEGLVAAALVAAGVVTVVGIMLQVSLVALLGEGQIGGSQLESVLETRFGLVYFARLPILAALMVILLGRVRRLALAGLGGSERGPTPLWWLLWGLLGLAFLATSSLSGHASASQPLALTIPNDVVHLAAGASWFAGIVVLSVALPDAWRDQPTQARLRLLSESVNRFSMLALVAIAIVAITGTLNSFINIAEPRDLLTSEYGLTLLSKLGIFALLLTFAGLNRFVVRRRLQVAAGLEGPVDAKRLFRRTIAIELMIGIALFGASALLTGLARTRDYPQSLPEPPFIERASEARSA